MGLFSSGGGSGAATPGSGAPAGGGSGASVCGGLAGFCGFWGLGFGCFKIASCWSEWPAASLPKLDVLVDFWKRGL
ncbi:hypothetical protein Drorol1_Dr00025015 [Drosera rotundifolia]